MMAGRQTPAETAKDDPERVDVVRQDAQVSEASRARARGHGDRRARPGDPRARRGRRRKTGRAPGEPRNVAYLYILPGLAAYLIFTFFPLLQTVRLSFYDWDGLTPKKWIGLDNYRELWNTPEIQAAFQHSVELILFYAVFSIVLGLVLTALLTRFRVRGFLFFRTVLFMPQTIATVVVAQAFVWIYDPSGRSTNSCARSASTSWPRRGSVTSHGRCRPSA